MIERRCAGRTDLFFSETAADLLAAIAVCEDCPVAAPCRHGAQQRREQHGVWGGWVAPKGRIPLPVGRRLTAASPQGHREHLQRRPCESLAVGTSIRVTEDRRAVAWTVTSVDLVSGLFRITLESAGVTTAVVRRPTDVVELDATL